MVFKCIYRRKYILKRIDLWSINLKSLVILLTIIFICILGYFFTLRSTLEKKEKIYLKSQFLKKQFNSQLLIISKYSNYQKKIKKLNQFDLCLQEKNFWAGDSSNKINFSNLLKMKINLSGTNNNIFKFINEAVALNKIILIKSFRWNFFNPITKNINQSIIIALNFYICNHKKLILDLSKINRLAAKSLIENNNITKFSLDKIVMLGSLSTAKGKNWGFVRLPNKQICKVKLGDYLGLEQGLVIGIYATKIIIKKNSNLEKILKLLNKSKSLFYVKNFT